MSAQLRWPTARRIIINAGTSVHLAARSLASHFEFSENLQGACFAASHALSTILRSCGVAAEVVHGSFDSRRWHNCHCWVECRERIVDVTATQFGITQSVYMPSDHDSARYYAEERGRRAVHVVVSEHPGAPLREAARIKRLAEQLWAKP